MSLSLLSECISQSTFPHHLQARIPLRHDDVTACPSVSWEFSEGRLPQTVEYCVPVLLQWLYTRLQHSFLYQIAQLLIFFASYCHISIGYCDGTHFLHISHTPRANSSFAMTKKRGPLGPASAALRFTSMCLQNAQAPGVLQKEDPEQERRRRQTSDITTKYYRQSRTFRRRKT